jgi:hypothetical protein
MTLVRIALSVAGAASAAAFLTVTPASAHTICRPDGFCFNTSGQPVAPWQQPALQGGYANGYYPYHYHRYWRHYYY